MLDNIHIPNQPYCFQKTGWLWASQVTVTTKCTFFTLGVLYLWKCNVLWTFWSLSRGNLWRALRLLLACSISVFVLRKYWSSNFSATTSTCFDQNRIQRPSKSKQWGKNKRNLVEGHVENNNDHRQTDRNGKNSCRHVNCDVLTHWSLGTFFLNSLLTAIIAPKHFWHQGQRAVMITLLPSEDTRWTGKLRACILQKGGEGTEGFPQWTTCFDFLLYSGRSDVKHRSALRHATVTCG